MAVKGLKIPKQIKVHDDCTVSAQFHITFFYENGLNKFFFGRSSRSSVMALKQGAGNAWSSDTNDYMYVHTNLNKKDRGLDEQIKLVIETVIITEREYRGSKEVKHLSGGYSVFKIFQSGNEGQIVDVFEGTPRDLIIGAEGEKSSATISLQFKSCPQLDHL
jgi:hypothetical protein